MATKGTFTAVLLALAFISCHASELQRKAQQQQEDVGDEEGRLFLTGTGTNQSVTIGTDTALALSLLVLGLIAAVIVLSVLLGSDGGYGASGYSAPSSYAAPPVYEESSYAVHRSLEDGARKFE